MAMGRSQVGAVKSWRAMGFWSVIVLLKRRSYDLFDINCCKEKIVPGRGRHQGKLTKEYVRTYCHSDFRSICVTDPHKTPDRSISYMTTEEGLSGRHWSQRWAWTPGSRVSLASACCQIPRVRPIKGILAVLQSILCFDELWHFRFVRIR